MKAQETENDQSISGEGNQQEFCGLNEDDQEMIRKLYEENIDFLIYYASKECKNDTAAEDVVHDTFCFAMRDKGIKKLKTHNNPMGWLMKVLQYKIQAYHRRMANWDTPDIDDFQEQLSITEEMFGRTELNMVLDKIFSPHEWMLFYMYYVEGHSAREMALLEGITEDNFKVRMYRLRKKVAKELES